VALEHGLHHLHATGGGIQRGVGQHYLAPLLGGVDLQDVLEGVVPNLMHILPGCIAKTLLETSPLETRLHFTEEVIPVVQEVGGVLRGCKQSEGRPKAHVIARWAECRMYQALGWWVFGGVREQILWVHSNRSDLVSLILIG